MSLIRLNKEDILKINVGERLRLIPITFGVHCVEVYAINNPLICWAGADRDRTFSMFDYKYYVKPVAGVYGFFRKLMNKIIHRKEDVRITCLKKQNKNRRESAISARHMLQEFIQWRNELTQERRDL